MPKGIPKNGINKGWIKNGSKLSQITRERMSKSKNSKKNNKIIRYANKF